MAKTIRIPAIPVIWIVMGLFLPIEGVLLWACHTASQEWKDTIVFGATVVGGAFALYGHMKHYATGRLCGDAQPGLRNENANGRGTDRSADKPGYAQSRRWATEVALAVRTDQADEGLLRRILSSVLEMAWDEFQPWYRENGRFWDVPTATSFTSSFRSS
jgi:hypothetical protein